MALQEKDGYQLEEGYRLEKIIDRLTYPSNIEFSEAGDIYVTEAGFTLLIPIFTPDLESYD
jgi:hypothetical protein